ncbi:hypothetical protein Sterm_3815 [Sebaldella termitidis ATCC 33386]|uniref:Uncharacterized protein n=1 Tax=Sebaldella termitidis (strain ATCC 33386 / NCTC 11300) TaxID=526218 RepID=D1AG23_SEBTE|nr:hypothetical protein Sterm_3815 [Sebaldella termitidis ATCC 33386]
MLLLTYYGNFEKSFVILEALQGKAQGINCNIIKKIKNPQIDFTNLIYYNQGKRK